MTLAHFTEPNLLLPRLPGEGRESAITELSNCLERAGRIKSVRSFARAVLDHETLVSTVFDEVAFSLARAQTIRKLSFALGLSQKGIRWGTGKAPTVHVVVLFAVPLSVGQAYISLVVTFSRLLKNKTAFSALRQSAEPGEILAALKRVRLLRTGPQLEVGDY